MAGRRSVTAGASSAERGRVLENSVVVKPEPSTGRRKTPMQQQREYVGIDLHRRRVASTPEPAPSCFYTRTGTPPGSYPLVSGSPRRARFGAIS
jgi:hypothetical protein